MNNFHIYVTLAIINAFFLTSGALGQTTIGDVENPMSGNPLTSQPRGQNMITCNEYEAIKYNGYTIAQIAATEGAASQIQQLWGNYTSTETINIVAIAKYYYNDNRFSFRESELTGFSIQEPGWPVTVLGKNINVGDTFSELQQKFGNDLKIIHKPDITADYAVSFSCDAINSEGMLVYLNAATHKVVKITYYVST